MTPERRHRTDAKELLIHYMKTMWVKSGLKWNTDNEAEMGSLIDHIILANPKTNPEADDALANNE